MKYETGVGFSRTGLSPSAAGRPRPLPLIIARHYSRNHGCFLFLRVLRCFTSPRFLPKPIYSAVGNTTSLVLGFPIRRSSDQSSVGSSPRLIAASYVLLRLLVPRHSPCALKNLANKIAKTSLTRKRARLCLDARNHYSEVKVHTPPPSRVTTQRVASGPNSVPAFQFL
ncbi:Uncharacterised protein [Mycobacteroides abscessus subsp. massiliense]|nr:Uncharacterised protein [Mycobacteroides abscessus subsp. massiliense]